MGMVPTSREGRGRGPLGECCITMQLVTTLVDLLCPSGLARVLNVC